MTQDLAGPVDESRSSRTTAVAEAREALVGTLPSWPDGFAILLDAFEAAVRASERREDALIAALQASLEVYRKECDTAHDAGFGLYEQAMAGFNLARNLRAALDGVASAGQAYENQATSLVQEGRESPTQD